MAPISVSIPVEVTTPTHEPFEIVVDEKSMFTSVLGKQWRQ
jgi:hypothetical protein